MPFELIWEPKGLHKRFYGSVSTPEFLESIHSLQGDSRFDSVRYSLNDFSDVRDFDISLQDVKQFAAYGAGAYFTNSNIKIAVVTDNPRIIELVKHYGSLPFSKYPLQIFPDIEGARAWLQGG